MPTPPTNYWLLIRQRFLKNSKAKWSARLLVLLMLLALLGDFLVGDIPIYCQINQNDHFPIFQKYSVQVGLSSWSTPFQNADWRTLPYEKVVYPLIPYSATSRDRKNQHYVSPLANQEVASRKYHHWMGTNKMGQDIAAGMFSGLRTALLVGLLSMLVASVIGISLGGLAGYFGDEAFTCTRGRLWLNVLALVLGIYFAFIARAYAFSEGHFMIELLKALGIVAIMLLIFNGLVKLVERIPFFNKTVSLPIDLLVMRLVEILNAIPGLLLILALAAVIQTASIYSLIFIIGIIGWTGIARFVRAELLKIRKQEYIQATKALGFSHWRALFRHALPNALGPVLIAIAFGIPSAILAEATLSFLGIGIPAGQVTWGTILSEARGMPSAWWLAVFPGLAIFLMVLLFNLIGEGLQEALKR